MAMATGFASPAQGYEAGNIDLNALFVRNPPATFLMRQETSDMVEYGILAGALLVVDRSLPRRSGALAVIAVEGEFLCRELRIQGRRIFFTNGKNDIAGANIEIFGVVRAAINDYAR